MLGDDTLAFPLHISHKITFFNNFSLIRINPAFTLELKVARQIGRWTFFI